MEKKTAGKLTSRTTLAEIRTMLYADGYDSLLERAREIKRAALAGCCVWTRDHIITTDASRIHAVPLTWQEIKKESARDYEKLDGEFHGKTQTEIDAIVFRATVERNEDR